MPQTIRHGKMYRRSRARFAVLRRAEDFESDSLQGKRASAV